MSFPNGLCIASMTHLNPGPFECKDGEGWDRGWSALCRGWGICCWRSWLVLASGTEQWCRHIPYHIIKMETYFRIIKSTCVLVRGGGWNLGFGSGRSIWAGRGGGAMLDLVCPFGLQANFVSCLRIAFRFVYCYPMFSLKHMTSIQLYLSSNWISFVSFNVKYIQIYLNWSVSSPCAPQASSYQPIQGLSALLRRLKMRSKKTWLVSKMSRSHRLRVSEREKNSCTLHMHVPSR